MTTVSPEVAAARAQRLTQFSKPISLANLVVDHIDRCIKNFQSSAIYIQVAEQNELDVRAKVIEYVAQKENWSHVDPSSYGSFDVALQNLYLKHTIIVKMVLKPMSSPDYSFMDADISGYTKFFYDLELNATDPYFDVIKRDYYNDVSS